MNPKLMCASHWTKISLAMHTNDLKTDTKYFTVVGMSFSYSVLNCPSKNIPIRKLSLLKNRVYENVLCIIIM